MNELFKTRFDLTQPDPRPIRAGLQTKRNRVYSIIDHDSDLVIRISSITDCVRLYRLHRGA